MTPENPEKKPDVPEFDLGTEVAPTTTFNAFVRENLMVKLNEEELKKIGIEPPEMVKITVQKIPDEGGE